jgi:hypothetical protein
MRWVFAVAVAGLAAQARAQATGGSGGTGGAYWGSSSVGTFCDNSCAFANDGICQDGAGGSDPRYGNACSFGTDCADCGPRREFLIPSSLHTSTQSSRHLIIFVVLTAHRVCSCSSHTIPLVWVTIARLTVCRLTNPYNCPHFIPPPQFIPPNRTGEHGSDEHGRSSRRQGRPRSTGKPGLCWRRGRPRSFRSRWS